MEIKTKTAQKQIPLLVTSFPRLEKKQHRPETASRPEERPQVPGRRLQLGADPALQPGAGHLACRLQVPWLLGVSWFGGFRQKESQDPIQPEGDWGAVVLRLGTRFAVCVGWKAGLEHMCVCVLCSDSWRTAVCAFWSNSMCREAALSFTTLGWGLALF
jgi:hypothetical protein